jgi:hypothetical protein
VPGAAPGAYDEVYSNEAVTTPLPASDTAPALLLSTAVCAAAAAADEPTAAPQSKRTRASTSDAGGAGSDVQLPTPMPAPAAPVVVVAASARNGGRSTRKRSFATTSDVDVCGTDPTGAGDASFAASAAGSSLAAISEIGESSDADDADAAADGADAGDVDADADADDATSDAAVCVDDSLPAPDADGFADDATVIEDAEDADAFDISFVEPVSPTPATAPTGGRSARASLTGLGSVAEATSFIPGADSDAGASPRALSFTSTEPAAIATTAAAAAEAARALLDVSTGYVSPARSTGPDADTGAPHTGANASFDAGELSARKRQQHSLVRRSLGADTAGDADADADSTAGDDTGLNASLLERCLSLPVTAASDAAADASEATAAAAEAAAATEEFGSAVPADSGPKKRRASPRSLKVRSRTAAAAVADDEAASVCSAASDASSGLPAPHGLLGPHNPSSPIPSKDPSLRRRRTGLTGGTALAMSDDDDATAAALALSVLPPSEIDGGQTYLDSLMPITPMSVRRAPARPQLAAGEAAEPGVAARLRFDAGADDDAAATEDAAPVNKSVVTASAPVPPLSEPDAAASEGIVTPSMSPLASASPRKRALGPREGSASSTPAVSAAAFAFAAVDAALAAGSAAPPSAASAAARPRPVANRGMCVPCSPTRRPPRAALKGSRAAAVAAGAVVAAPVASPTASPGTPGRSRRTLRFSHTHWAQFSIFPDWGKVPHDETVGCAVGLARVPLAAGVMTVKGRETLHPTVDSCSIDACTPHSRSSLIVCLLFSPLVLAHFACVGRPRPCLLSSQLSGGTRGARSFTSSRPPRRCSCATSTPRTTAAAPRPSPPAPQGCPTTRPRSRARRCRPSSMPSALAPLSFLRSPIASVTCRSAPSPSAHAPPLSTTRPPICSSKVRFELSLATLHPSSFTLQPTPHFFPAPPPFRPLVLNPTTAWHRLFVSLAEDLAARHCHSVADSPADALEPCPPRPLPPAPATRALARRFLATASLADFTDAGDLKRLKAQRGFAGCSCRRRVPLCPHRDYVFDAALVAALLPPPYGTGAAYPYHERLWLTPEERAAAAAGTLPPPDADAGADGEPPAEPYTGEVYETLDQMAYALAETLGLKEDTRVFTDSEGGLWSDDIESAAGDCKMCELLVWDRVGRCDNNFCPCLRSGVKCTAYVHTFNRRFSLVFFSFLFLMAVLFTTSPHCYS